MCEVECEFICKCTSYPAKCGRCQRNMGKRDYFKPDEDYYIPYPYPHPYYPWYPYTTIGTTTWTWATKDGITWTISNG